MVIDESKARIKDDPDYIGLKRFNYSLAELLERYPDGCPNKVIAHALMISEEEVEALYNEAIKKLRDLMGVK